MTKASTDYGFFRIEELTDGVFAAVGDQDGLCHSNAGIVDLGDRTLVFDTLTLPTYGEALAAACRDLTGRDPTWIAFSHYHGDHLLGNQAFPDPTALIATDAMLPLVDAWMTEYQKAVDDPSEFAEEIDTYAAGCESEHDPTRREVMEVNLARWRALYDALPSLRLVRPNTAFCGTLRLVGSERTVELIEVADAHTASDVYLRLPDDGVVFLGDLGFFDTIPFLVYADPVHWAEVLRGFEASEVCTYVPGHGVVDGRDKVTAERECIEAVIAAVRAAIDAGDPVTEAVSDRLPKRFQAWALRGRFNEANYQAVAKSIQAS